MAKDIIRIWNNVSRQERKNILLGIERKQIAGIAPIDKVDLPPWNCLRAITQIALEDYAKQDYGKNHLNRIIASYKGG